MNEGGASVRETPLVSVVLPTYRRPEMLERALATVTAQTFQDWELIVVDDNGRGTEMQRATEAVVDRLAVDPRVTYRVQERNMGACAARNVGIREARGPFVAFLDDDDAWYPTKLERQVETFAASGPDVALVYGGFRRVDEFGGTRTVRADGTAHERRNLLRRNKIGTTSLILCRRSALLEVGGFDEELSSMQDYDLYVRLSQRYRFAWVEEPLLDKHRHPEASIGKNFQGILRANERFYEKHHHLYEGDPDIHHFRLRWFAFQAMHADEIALARRLLWRAWRFQPQVVSTLALAVFLNRPMLDVYRAYRRRVRERRAKRRLADDHAGADEE